MPHETPDHAEHHDPLPQEADLPPAVREAVQRFNDYEDEMFWLDDLADRAIAAPRPALGLPEHATPDHEAPEPPAEAGTIGHMALGEQVTRPADVDIRVATDHPAVYARAGAEPYLGTAKRGLDIQQGPGEADKATDYAEGLFPDADLSYIGGGRYGVVLGDDEGRAYKVYRSALNYSQSEREAGSLQLLGEAGLAPRVHLFVDADMQYRLDQKAYDYTKSGFEDVEIPRQNGGRELPVLIMDKVDAAPLETAEPDKYADGFCRVAEVYLRESIRSWDTEVMVDRQTGEVIILDTGGLSQEPLKSANPTEAERRHHDNEILRSVGLDFGLARSEINIKHAYAEGGLDAVRAYVQQVGPPTFK